MSKQYLSASLIREHLQPEVNQAWQALHILPKVDSTNRWLLDSDLARGICLAESQTAGRGRRGRVWQSPQAENIYLSVAWDFAEPPRYVSWISLMVGVAIAEALQTMGMQGQQVKWPNDIYHEQRKLGGILLQSTHNLKRFVIGIGLNVNMQHDDSQSIDQAWCSVAQIVGQTVDRNQWVAAILNRLWWYLDRFPQMDLLALQQAWQPWDLLFQHSVRVQEDNHILHGTACGVDEQGCLKVYTSPDTIQTFSSADVSVRL